MKKLIMLSVFALGTIASFASNTEKCINLSPCEEQISGYFRIQVNGLVYPGGFGFPTQQVFYTEYGWFTTASLAARKAVLISMYPDTFTGGDGYGIAYSVHHYSAKPPLAG